jgi:hypothetical protein
MTNINWIKFIQKTFKLISKIYILKTNKIYQQMLEALSLSLSLPSPFISHISTFYFIINHHKPK